MVFCTLFDSNYLDKGLVLFDSLVKNAGNFKLYVIAFDDKCYDVLHSLNDDRLLPIRMGDFENEELLAAKGNRSRGEYCWTCSSHAIAYILDNYDDQCTYVDADMYFYDDPQKVIDEMESSNCHTQIIEHRFDSRTISRRMMARSGRYCVEFNTFTNAEESRRALRWWQDRCLESCTVSADGKVFGDQKYLDQFQTLFKGINVVSNVGAGVAPWNIANYDLVSKDGDNIEIVYKVNEKIRTSLVFYHFHNLAYLNKDAVNIEVFSKAAHTSEALVEAIYYPYLKKIEEKRDMLGKMYGCDYSTRVIHPTSFMKLVKELDIKALIKRMKRYNAIEICQYVYYQKNRKKDIIDLRDIRR